MTFDMDKLTQEEYVDIMLTNEGFKSCVSLHRFTKDYSKNIMNTFIGTLQECKEKLVQVELEAKTEYTKYIGNMRTRKYQLGEEWFNYHTSGYNEIEKEFIKRLVDQLGIGIDEAVDSVYQFTDLLKDVNARI